MSGFLKLLAFHFCVVFFMLLVDWHRCLVCCCSSLVDRHLKHQSEISCKKPRCWRHMVLIPIHARFFKQLCTIYRLQTLKVFSNLQRPELVKTYVYLRFKSWSNVLYLFRMCLETRPSSPSPHLVLWCFRETREFIFSNGEPYVNHSLLSWVLAWCK